MAPYIITITTGPVGWKHGLTIRPEGKIDGLRGEFKGYETPHAFLADLARYLNFTKEDLRSTLQEPTPRQLHRVVNLSDRVAAYFGCDVEETKRIYILLRAVPVENGAAADQFTVTAEFKTGVPFSRPVYLSAERVLAVLKALNPNGLLHHKWNCHLEKRESFTVITVPTLWEMALARQGIDREDWYLAPMPIYQPILVYSDAIRNDIFDDKTSRLYSSFCRYTCTQCSTGYVLVVQVTDQAQFQSMPSWRSPHFQLLCEEINAEHPHHPTARIRSGGINVWPVDVSTGGPVSLEKFHRRERPLTDAQRLALLKSGIIT